MGTKWQMPIAVIGKPTGDGRQFAEGALSHRDLPVALRYVHSDSGGHKDAVVVGRITKIHPEADGLLPAEGDFFDGDEWPEDTREAAKTARMMTEQKVIGPSVDLDTADMESVPEPKALAAAQRKLKAAAKAHDCGCEYSDETIRDVPRVNLVTKGRIATATMVHIPAFAELAGHAVLTADAPPEEQDAAEGTEEFKQMDKVGGKTVDRDKIDTADFGDPDERKFPITNQDSVDAAAHLIGKASNPDAVKKRICAIAKRKGLSVPEGWEKMDYSVTAAVHRPELLAPPAAWFAKPDLDGPTPLTISDTGRVFGHAALWDTCHVGIGEACVKPPRSKTGYALFHTGELVTAEGERIAVGHLTYGGGHAAPNLGYRAAAEHYDATSHTGAVVRAGEDEYGIWVAGAMVADADPAAWAQMRRSPLSGDWRRVGGNLEMVAALHVNTPGFGIPRVRIASGVPQTLVAGGAAFSPLPRHDHGGDDGHGAGPGGVDPGSFARRVAQEILDLQRAEVVQSEWLGLVAAARADRTAELMSEYTAITAEWAQLDLKEAVEEE